LDSAIIANRDVVDTTRYQITITSFIGSKLLEDTAFESSLNSLDNFHYLNPIHRNFNLSLGFLGSPNMPFLFNQNHDVGLHLIPDNLEIYRYTPGKTRYYKTTKPYTRAAYLNGSKKEERLNLLHTQNVSENWNIGFEINRFSNQGFFQRQRTIGSNFIAHSMYESKSKKYGFLANFIVNNLTVEENGGIENPAFLADEVYSFREVIPVRFTNAVNLSSDKSFHVLNYYRLGKKDSIYVDEDSTYRQFVIPKYELYHSFTVDDRLHRFEDKLPVATNYPLHLQGINLYRNDFNYISFSNSLGFKRFINDADSSNVSVHLLTSVELSHTYYDIFHNGITRKIDNTLVEAELIKARIAKLTLKSNVEIGLPGAYNEGDFNFTNSANIPVYKNWEFDFNSNLSLKRAHYLMEYFYSDIHSWSNVAFNKVQSQQYNFSFNEIVRKIKVDIDYQLINNFIYLNHLQEAAQHNSLISIYRIGLNKLFRWKKYSWESKNSFQQSNSPAIVRMPQFITFNSFYKDGAVFKNRMKTRLGVDFFFNTSYFAYDYSPQLAMFYLQNNTMIGNYPYIDFFFSARVKTAKIFFKVSHLNAGLTGYNYFMAPSFPTNEFMIRFGFEWNFLN
jgi:hypothetical protein